MWSVARSYFFDWHVRGNFIFASPAIPGRLHTVSKHIWGPGIVAHFWDVGYQRAAGGNDFVKIWCIRV